MRIERDEGFLIDYDEEHNKNKSNKKDKKSKSKKKETYRLNPGQTSRAAALAMPREKKPKDNSRKWTDDDLEGLQEI